METGENNFTITKSSEFNSNVIQEYHLSIQLGLNSFTFTLLNTNSLTYEYLASYKFIANNIDECTEKIRSIINDNIIIKNTFSSVCITYTASTKFFHLLLIFLLLFINSEFVLTKLKTSS